MADDAAMATQEYEAVAWAVVLEDDEDHQQKWAKWLQKAHDELNKLAKKEPKELTASERKTSPSSFEGGDAGGLAPGSRCATHQASASGATSCAVRRRSFVGART